MNSKNIKRHLRDKIDDWINHVKDNDLKRVIRENVIVTGGGIGKPLK